jgi:Fe-S-cluster containining protein
MSSADVESCRGCGGLCCTAYIVPVTGYDVWRITQAQRLAPAVFVQREPEDYPTATGFRLRPGGLTYGLALRHRLVRHNQRPCIFLLQLKDGVKRCGMYAHRPLACQTYPMQLQQGQPGPRSDMLCPYGSWSSLGRTQAAWQQRLVQQEQEWEVYASVARAWNVSLDAQVAEGGYVFERYLDYLVNVYDHLDRHLAAHSEQPTAASLERELAALASTYIS